MEVPHPPLQRLYRLQDCLEGPDRILAFKIAWKDQTAFWVWLAANVVYGLFRDHEDGVSGVITIAAGILALVWWMRFCIRQAKSYGKGAGTGIAAFFLPNILTLYYGFVSSCTYAGPQD